MCSKGLPWPLPLLSSLSAVVELLPACKNKKQQKKAEGETIVQQEVAMADTCIVVIISSHQVAAFQEKEKHQKKAKGETIAQQEATAITCIVIAVSRCFVKMISCNNG